MLVKDIPAVNVHKYGAFALKREISQIFILPSVCGHGDNKARHDGGQCFEFHISFSKIYYNIKIFPKKPA